MSTLAGLRLQELPSAQEQPRATAPDGAVWQAWIAKGQRHDRRSNAARLKAIQWVSIAVLLVAAGFWSHITPCWTVVRFIVSIGAIVLLFHAFHARRYVFAAVFGALVLLYNPVAPVFSFPGDWQHVFVAASAAPFLASLAWHTPKPRELNEP